MKLNLFCLIFLAFFQSGDFVHFEADELSQDANSDYFEVNKILKIFSKENFANFLQLLSFEKLSQKCLNHTQVFQQNLIGNPVSALTHGYWELKSTTLKKLLCFDLV